MTSSEFLGASHLYFLILGSQKSKTSNISQFGVETREIWLIEARLCKEHSSTIMLTSTQNRGYLPWAFWEKPHMVLKLKKLGIQCFKQIAIQSWNKRDMVDWIKVAQRACNYWIELEPICFLLFGLNFWASFWAFLWQLGPLGFSFFTNPIFGCRAILVIWSLSKF